MDKSDHPLPASLPTQDYHAPNPIATDHAKTRALLCVCGAYLIWGVVGWYFKIVTVEFAVAPFTLLAHRVVWSLAFVILLLLARNEFGQLLNAFKDRKLVLGLTITSILVAINWITFIYAAGHGKLKEASLGYFLTPIMNVLLGVIVLRESLRAGQVFAVVLASIGVGFMVYYRADSVWIPLTLMISWSFYALLRKQFVVSPIVGLGVETAVLLPAALAFLVYIQSRHPVPVAPSTYGLLIAAGVITAVPLILFAKGARHLQLTTIGLLQYLGPTVQFIIATLVLHETVTSVELLSFACIWVGLILFSFDSYQAFRQRSSRKVIAT